MIEASEALVLDTTEENLDKEVSIVEQSAKDFVIACEADYQKAAEIAKTVKQMEKQVTDFWEPLRKSTHKAYNDVIEKKKQMLSPLESAESIIKKKMSAYVTEMERQRKLEEEKQRLLASQELENKLNEAAEAEKNGDTNGYEYAMAEAEMMETASVSTVVQNQVPKADGISKSKSWVITGIDSSKVPVNFNGMELRPVNEKLVMQLIKASKGTIQIPGVVYEETANIRIKV